MQFEIVKIGEQEVAEVASSEIIRNSQDALELLMNCSYQGTTDLIIQESNLSAEFFDLKTGVAGEILQKFSTYNGRLAIIGDFSNYQSKSLKDFIFESNKVGRINFVSSMEEAKTALTRNA
jgi:hypothetical protein